MSDLFHVSWYRVARLRPRLRSNARVHRHVYQGETWHVIEDVLTGRFNRLPPEPYLFLGLLDGDRTVEEAWRLAAGRLDDDVPTQGEIVRLLAQLYGQGLLLPGTAVDAAEIEKRRQTLGRAFWLQYVKSPLSVRIPLLDPDGVLTKLTALLSPLLSPFGALLWFALVATGIVSAIEHWKPLTDNIIDRVLAADNVWLMAAVYPFVKILHEFGHGVAVKRFGGDVHEMGILLLALFPVPYVDATRANAFDSKWRRVLVGSAGVLTELAVASVAMLVWASAGHGLVRAIAYNVIVIASVSTLIVNGNPLMRYDGYYVMMDLVEIPNFATRAIRYYGYLIQRYLFGVAGAQSPVHSPGERLWFLIYGPASFVYRWMVVITLILVVGSKYLLAGALLAIWATAVNIVLPLGNAIQKLATGPSLGNRRGRAVAVCAGAIALAVFLLAVLPLPRHRVVEGVVWVPENMWVRASAEGQFRGFAAEPGATVAAGDLLFTMENDQLPVNVTKAQAVVAEARVRRDAVWDNRAAFVAAGEMVVQAEKSLQLEEAKFGDLAVRAAYPGRFLLEERNLEGKYLSKGMLVGYIFDPKYLVVRVAVPQESAGEVRNEVQSVDLRLADHFDTVLHSAILREVPAATDRLPSATLATIGGGRITLKPEDRKALTAYDRYFQFDLELPPGEVLPRVGMRAYARFSLTPEPLIYRLYRRARQYAREHFRI